MVIFSFTFEFQCIFVKTFGSNHLFHERFGVGYYQQSLIPVAFELIKYGCSQNEPGFVNFSMHYRAFVGRWKKQDGVFIQSVREIVIKVGCVFPVGNNKPVQSSHILNNSGGK